MYVRDHLRYYQKEPLWLLAKQCIHAKLDSNLQRCLLDEGSLTSRLIQASAGNFEIRCLRQTWQLPLPSERRLLNIKTRQLAVIREVVLACHGMPWVFARSIFPASTLSGPLRKLHNLKNSSLGSLLFNTPSMTRSPFQLAKITGESNYLPSGLRHSEPVWGRRSKFMLYDKPLIVSEVFLPEFKPWPKPPSQQGHRY